MSLLTASAISFPLILVAFLPITYLLIYIRLRHKRLENHVAYYGTAILLLVALLGGLSLLLVSEENRKLLALLNATDVGAAKYQVILGLGFYIGLILLTLLNWAMALGWYGKEKLPWLLIALSTLTFGLGLAYLNLQPIM